MAGQIKFTSFGIPYVPEFENVSFVPEPPRCVAHPPPSPSSSSSSFCYIDIPTPPPRPPPVSLRSPSSFFKRKPPPTRHVVPSKPPNDSEMPLTLEDTKPPLPQPDASETHGICIRFPRECGHPQMTRKERLVYLQQIISVAVLDAGMSRSPGSRTEKHSNGNPAHVNPGYKTPDALFCGTYGQMMAALEGAGLSATPCVGEDLSGYTRLGVLFVARNDGASGVQLRKITLWG